MDEKYNIPIYFEKVKSFDVNDDRFIKCKVWIAHTGVNKNNWIFTRDALLDSIPSLTNIPIVAFVQKNDDSENDFSDHREVLEIDKDKIKVSYKGKAIGVITSDNNAQLETKICDDGLEREFLTCDGLLWTKFDDSIDIFKRDETKDQSMEIDKYVGTFNKYKQYECTQFRFTGLCALGCGVEPAMYSASIDANFALDEIKTKLEQFNNYFSKQSQTSNDDDIDNIMKGGQSLTTEIIDSIYAEFSLTKEEVNFEITDDTTEEILRDHLSNFACDKKKATFSLILGEFNVTSDELGEYNAEITESDFRTLVSEFAKTKNESSNPEPDNKTKAVFSTYNQKRELLQGALPSTREYEDDNDILKYAVDYYVADFDDSYVYVSKDECKDGKWTYSHGRFGYTLEDNKVTIVGEFEVMISKWVTPEEDAEIENARAKFEAQTSEFERLKQFEVDKLKADFDNNAKAIFSRFDEQLANTTEYDVLKADFSDMKLDIIEEKCFAILGKKNANFSVKPNTQSVVSLGVDNENDIPDDDGYGGLLSKKYNK